jgi:hypothetical protein
MSKNNNLEKEFVEIKNRIEDILKILDIYVMDDAESIKSLKNELDSYNEKLKVMINV